MKAEPILARLEKVKRTGDSNWLACCPAHDDKNPSMTVREVDDGRVLVHCFSGCSFESIVAAIGVGHEPFFPPGERDVFQIVRRPYPAADVLEALAQESLIVYIIACDMHKGVPVSDEDHARLGLSIRRIQEARDVANGYR